MRGAVVTPCRLGAATIGETEGPDSEHAERPPTRADTNVECPIRGALIEGKTNAIVIEESQTVAKG